MDFHDHILSTLGHAPDHIEPGVLHRFSTNGKRSDTSGWCKLFEDGKGGVFGDFRAGISSSWSSVDRRLMTPAERAAFARQVAQAAHEREVQRNERHKANAHFISGLLAATVEVTAGDPVARYFANRGLAGVWNFAPCIRLHPGLSYSHEGERLGVFPTMVAPLQAPDGKTVALHRTYLTPTGRKADVPTVKKLTPAAGTLKGAAIRLQPPRDGVLGVAEGIETALAASMVSALPVWSTYCANGIETFNWPPFIRRLVIFSDADDAGRSAAESLRQRAVKARLSVSVMTPRTEGLDWLDVYASEEVVQ